ncbi:hypothetical protein [Legionella parisiensis]|nr:hypothetical protein [Legionella parisiensis]
MSKPSPTFPILMNAVVAFYAQRDKALLAANQAFEEDNNEAFYYRSP